MKERRVVISGMGAVTPSGSQIDVLWNQLIQGKSSAGLIDSFDASQFPTKIACLVKDLDPSKYLNPKEIKRMDPFIKFAVAAAQMALSDSGLDVGSLDVERVGVLVGSGAGGLKSFQDAYRTLLEKGPTRVSPLSLPMFIPNMASAEISIRLGAKGPNFCVVTACASSAHAIGEAARLIEYGDADVIFAGGSEASAIEVGVACFSAMGALSQRNDDPQRASRPFDKDRDGFVMGEGAGIVVLEELEHARKRGARIYAELTGYGLSGDAFHITAPPPDHVGAVQAMKRALEHAEIDWSQIDYINAHGTSTILNDKSETQAIKQVFKDLAMKIPVSSTKSMTGHMIGAAGAVELIISILVINRGVIPPTINYETPDPDCDLDYVPNTARESKVQIAMSNSFGFGGHNATLIVKRFSA